MLINTTENDIFDDTLAPLWDYLAPSAPLMPTDILFVFGGLDIAVPKYAAQLFKSGAYGHIIVSGATGPLTAGVFSQSEAQTFADIMTQHGVPSSKIILEENATNTGENVCFDMERLQEMGIAIESATLVSKSFLMRRALLTFKKQYPHIVTIPAPPPGPSSRYLDRPKMEFVERLIAEVDRLIAYEQQGFTAHADIPSSVIECVQALRKNAEINF